MARTRTQATPEAKREQGRRGMRAVLTKRIDPSGELLRRDPAEFERQYEVAKQAHMAKMNDAHRASAAEKRAAPKVAKIKTTTPAAPPVPFLWTCCPTCNEDMGVRVPHGAPVALCVRHYLGSRPWYPLGAHEWSMRQPWLVDGSLQARTPQVS